MISNQIFSAALAINDPWFIENIELNQETKQLDVYISFRRGATFPSKNPDYPHEYKAYDSVLKTWRHLNFFEYKCFLHCRTPRIQPDKGKTELISPPWTGINAGFTLMFEAFLLQLCVCMPVKAASRIVGENDDKLWRLLEKYTIGARSHEDYTDLENVGMDETSQKKNHNYVSLFVDLNKGRTVYVSEGKSHETVEKFARDLRLHQVNPEHILNVSCDMSPAFIKGVAENLPNATITFDRFHVVKIINEAVDQVRREEVIEQPILKGNRYIFLKNNENLTTIQSTTLNRIRLSYFNLKTYRALRIREAFQNIYQASDYRVFEKLLKKWYYWATHSRLEPMIKAAKTIKNHWDGILSWKLSQINNGILEGLNSVIQAAKSKARGYRNFRYFRTIIYLLTGKLDFKPINKHIALFS